METGEGGCQRARAEQAAVRFVRARSCLQSLAIHALLIRMGTRRSEAAFDSFDGTPLREFLLDEDVFAISDPY